MAEKQQSSIGPSTMPRSRRDISTRVKDAVVALATCHNVSTLPLHELMNR